MQLVLLILSLSSAQRARILAALHIVREHQYVDQVLNHCDIVDIEKSHLEKKMDNIVSQHPHLQKEKEPASTATTTQTKHDNEDKSFASKPTSGKQDNPKTDQLQRKKKCRKIDKLRRQLQSLEAVRSQGGEESKHIDDGIIEKGTCGFRSIGNDPSGIRIRIISPKSLQTITSIFIRLLRIYHVGTITKLHPGNVW